MRIKFLVLTPVCVFLGTSSVMAIQEQISIFMLGLVTLGALLAHVSVNTLNEYFDYKSGLDLLTRRKGFSGGSGALPGNPECARAVLVTGVVSLVIVVLTGAFLSWKLDIRILPIGIAGVVLIATYTGWINKHPVLCLLALGAGFGLLMTVGTQLVMGDSYLPLAWIVALVTFFLTNNFLLLNQYPDIEADARVGRNHFPICYGLKRSNMVYALFALAATLVIDVGSASGYLPLSSLISLLLMPLAIFALSGAIKHGADIGSFPQYLGANVCCCGTCAGITWRVIGLLLTVCKIYQKLAFTILSARQEKTQI